MANDFNHITLQGRLVKSAEVKFPRQDFCVVSFTIATNENYKNGDQWEKRPNYIDCTWTGNYAKALSESMTKGREVFLEGILHQDRWEKDGQKQSKIIVKVTNLVTGRTPGEKQGNGSVVEDPAENSAVDEQLDDIPF